MPVKIVFAHILYSRSYIIVLERIHKVLPSLNCKAVDCKLYVLREVAVNRWHIRRLPYADVLKTIPAGTK